RPGSPGWSSPGGGGGIAIGGWPGSGRRRGGGGRSRCLGWGSGCRREVPIRTVRRPSCGSGLGAWASRRGGGGGGRWCAKPCRPPVGAPPAPVLVVSAGRGGGLRRVVRPCLGLFGGARVGRLLGAL